MLVVLWMALHLPPSLQQVLEEISDDVPLDDLRLLSQPAHRPTSLYHLHQLTHDQHLNAHDSSYQIECRRESAPLHSTLVKTRILPGLTDLLCPFILTRLAFLIKLSCLPTFAASSLE